MVKPIRYTGTTLLFACLLFIGYLNFSHQSDSNPIAFLMLFAALSKLPDKYELHTETLIGWLLIITSCILTYKFSHHQMTFESSDGVIFVNLAVMYFLGWWLAGLKKLRLGR